MAIPKMQLDLDEMIEGDYLSIADSAIAEGVEDEKCVVGQYRTTKSQKQAFSSLLKTCDRDNIPIEWVIDIADESNGWFYATAYHYDDTKQMLHVMVPDKENPTFDGHVQLDHRTVHLIECVDRTSMALFNKIVRDSVVKVKWDVEWLEEYEAEENQRGEQVNNGQWIDSVARYYIRIANQLLVEDREFEDENPDQQNSKGFVIITADLNVRLIHCHKNKGIEDFHRLIAEGIVSFTEEAEEEANQAIQALSDYDATANGGGREDQPPSNSNSNNNKRDRENQLSPNNRSNQENNDPRPNTAGDVSVFSNSSSTPAPLSLKKLTEVVRHLKESLQFINDDYDKKKKEEVELSDLFTHFVLSGDLEEGQQLMEYFQKVQSRNDHRLTARNLSTKKTKTNDENDLLFSPATEATMENGAGGEWEETTDDPEEKQYRKIMKLLDHAMHNSTKLEKQCVRLLKHGFDILNTGSPAGGVVNSPAGKVEEYELLKKEYKKLRKELDQKESELRSLKGSNNGASRR